MCDSVQNSTQALGFFGIAISHTSIFRKYTQKNVTSGVFTYLQS
jgi:hypothetical protein